MAARLDKPWIEVSQIAVVLRGHMGVFQLADADNTVIYMGYAGGNSLQGLRGEVTQACADHPDACYFRHEITTSYLSRFRELMMVYMHDHGRLPAGNPKISLGRMSPG